MHPNCFRTSSVYFVIMIFASIHVPVSLSQDLYKNCGQFLQCQIIFNKSYPFWGRNQPEYCSCPGLQLTYRGDYTPWHTVQSRKSRPLARYDPPQILTVAREELPNTSFTRSLNEATLDTSIFNYALNTQYPSLHYCCTPLSKQNTFCPRLLCNVTLDVVTYGFSSDIREQSRFDTTWDTSCPRFLCNSTLKKEFYSSASSPRFLYNATLNKVIYNIIHFRGEPSLFNTAWDTSCPRFLCNSTLNKANYNYASSTQNLRLYYGCTPVSGQTQLFNPFKCSVDGIKSVSYYASTDLMSSVNTNLGTCNNSVFVQGFQSFAVGLASNSPSTNISAAPPKGSALQWTAADVTDCNRCVQSGGRCVYHLNSSSFICLWSDQPYPLRCDTTRSVKKINLWLKLAIGFSAALAGISVVSVVIIYSIRRGCLLCNTMSFRKEQILKDQNVEAFLRNYGSLAPSRYRYSDIKRMTNSFKEILGQGGYGVVYKGKLSDGRLVAVKLLRETKGGNGEEFVNEVDSISRTSHVNVVTLMGFCYQGPKRALVYEFMPNGSLDKFIHKVGSLNTNPHLECKTLCQIAVGIARGLEYLHRGCNTRIVHFDIKPHNILLDEDFCPKIADFGLSKLCQRKESTVSMLGTRGTPGYIAPEIICRDYGGVPYKSDVYSYGMMVLEMIGAKENVEVGANQTSETFFPDWIYEHLEHVKYLKLTAVTNEEEEEIARKMIMVSLWCIQTNPSDRPSMSKVLEMLEGSIQALQIPPKPYLFSPIRVVQDSSASLSEELEKKAFYVEHI